MTTCGRCSDNPGWVVVADVTTGEVLGWSACWLCRPHDHALVMACKALEGAEEACTGNVGGRPVRGK